MPKLLNIFCALFLIIFFHTAGAQPRDGKAQSLKYAKYGKQHKSYQKHHPYFLLFTTNSEVKSILVSEEEKNVIL